ncbi:MAG: Bug family tripartite tricarboxylate transporter substrate binding protein, partial [Ramlibacter sp.]
FFDNISSSAQFHQAGKLRILAVADEQRSRTLPQVPTFVEAGLPGMLAVTFFSVVAPPGTPAAIASTLQKQIAEALAEPDVRQKFAEQGADARGWSPEQTGRFIQADTDKWKKVIRAANVTLE